MDPTQTQTRRSFLQDARARFRGSWDYMVHDCVSDCQSRTAEEMWGEHISSPVVITGPLLMRDKTKRTPEEENIEYHHTYFIDDLKSLAAIRKGRAAGREEILPNTPTTYVAA